MSNRLCREEIAQNVFFSSVTDSRYKTNRISVNFMTPLTKQTVTENALLSAMIRKSNTEYKNFTEISKRLCDLYGAYLDSGVMKIGETQGVNLYVSAIDNRYALNGEDITTMTAELLCSLVFNSKALNGGYDESELAIEKQVLINLIESEINEKRSYAIRKCTKIMCENEAFSIPRYGFSEDVNGITNENLKTACERLIKTARVEIFYRLRRPQKRKRDIYKGICRRKP